MNKPLVILSIDGGGIRGILAGLIVSRLEHIIQNISRNKNAHLSNYIDFFSGTSTGAILSLLYNCPVNGNGTPYYASDAVKLYLENAKRVFKKNRHADRNEKYSAEAIEELFNYYFCEITLANLLKPCLITSYNTESNNTHFFTSHTAHSKSTHNYFVRDVARATTAAPGFFSPANIASFSGHRYNLIDGGVFANNPALCAYTEVAQIFKKKEETFSFDDVIIISVGTGKGDPLFMQQSNDSMEVIIARDSATTDFQMKTLFSSAGFGNNYYRFDPMIGDANNALDDISYDNIKRLTDAGERSADYFSDQLTEIARRILSITHNVL